MLFLLTTLNIKTGEESMRIWMFNIYWKFNICWHIFTIMEIIYRFVLNNSIPFIWEYKKILKYLHFNKYCTSHVYQYNTTAVQVSIKIFLDVKWNLTLFCYIILYWFRIIFTLQAFTFSKKNYLNIISLFLYILWRIEMTIKSTFNENVVYVILLYVMPAYVWVIR